MSRYKDFDAFDAERVKEPITFKIKSETYSLPSALPAIIPIKAMRLQKQYGSESDIPESDLLEIACSMFGDDDLQRLLGSGISIDELGDIITWLFSQYSGEAQALPNSPTPMK